LTLDDISTEQKIDLIKQIKNSVGDYPSTSDIYIWEKDNRILYYSVYNIHEGRLSIHQETKDSEIEVQISTMDYNGVFPFMSGIKKPIYWYLNENIELKYYMIVIQEYIKFDNDSARSMLQIVGKFNKCMSIHSIEMMWHLPHVAIVKQPLTKKSPFLSLDEENVLAKLEYFKFKQPENYNSLFDDLVEGPNQIPIDMEAIKRKLTILEACSY